MKPSQQAPVPSSLLIRAPPPWPPTLHTGRPIPAVCRWLSSGHHTPTKVKHHLPQQILAFLALFFWLAPPFLSLCIIQMLEDRRHRIFVTFVTVSSCPKPRRLVPLFLIAYTSGILFHFCLSAGSCAPGFVLYVSRFLCPPPVSYFCLSCFTVIYLPLSCSFFALPVQYALCLCLFLASSLAPLIYNISLLTWLMNTVLVWFCPLCPLSLCALLKACSVSDWISEPSSFLPVLSCLLIKSHWSRRSDRGKRIPLWQGKRRRTNGFYLGFT